MYYEVKNLDLLHISWNGEDGIVSLKEDTVICHVQNDGMFYAHPMFPHVKIYTNDFRDLFPNLSVNVYYSWDFVCRLLKHPDFPWGRRITYPEI